MAWGTRLRARGPLLAAMAGLGAAWWCARRPGDHCSCPFREDRLRKVRLPGERRGADRDRAADVGGQEAQRGRSQHRYRGVNVSGRRECECGPEGPYGCGVVLPRHQYGGEHVGVGQCRGAIGARIVFPTEDQDVSACRPLKHMGHQFWTVLRAEHVEHPAPATQCAQQFVNLGAAHFPCLPRTGWCSRCGDCAAPSGGSPAKTRAAAAHSGQVCHNHASSPDAAWICRSHSDVSTVPSGQPPAGLSSALACRAPPAGTQLNG
ncbi:hypothetical protein A8926_3685 [Saccharopolyspora spinosa]|uniref:Uncharacterized protein n=1 Tax=Saccharopolyspora spinosa TaxID=60894 RepID=A0A2N3XYZ0_SACSN|nr:hypothetical protein A8926_3685 [Saccharopolyspora spinosa]